MNDYSAKYECAVAIILGAVLWRWRLSAINTAGDQRRCIVLITFSCDITKCKKKFIVLSKVTKKFIFWKISVFSKSTHNLSVKTEM